MKYALALAAILIASPAMAGDKPQTPAPWTVANLQCGIRPITPIGCHGGQAVCSCNAYGCSWMWIGCR